jgi:hypothetical protein
MWSEDKAYQDTSETLCHSVSSSSVSVSDLETIETETLIRYRRGGLRLAEVWFGEMKPTKCDIVKYVQAARKPASVQAVRFTTLCIDITQPPERVLLFLSPETRHKVRRVEACDGFVHEFDLHPCF